MVKVRFTLDRRTDRVIPIYPQNFVCGGFNKWFHSKQHLQYYNVQIVETPAEIKKVKCSNPKFWPGDLVSKFIIILNIIHVTVFTNFGQNTAKSLDIHILWFGGDITPLPWCLPGVITRYHGYEGLSPCGQNIQAMPAFICCDAYIFYC